MKRQLPALAAVFSGLLAPSATFGQEAASAQLDEVVVTAQREGDSYAAPVIATGGLKTETPLLETPQAISVLSENIIRDQDARKLEDVIKNVAGVTPGGYYEDWDYYRIRGFDSSFNTFWDGLRGDYGTSPEMYGLERVEVIKGPASTLYGNAPLGGLVNLISKRPYRTFGGEVTITGGTWSFYEGAFDINVPLLVPGVTLPSDDGKNPKAPVVEPGVGVYGRLVGLYKNAGSYVDYVETERIFVAPSLLIDFGDDSTLTLLTEYKRDWGKFAMPLPALGTVLPSPYGEVPVSRYLGLPDSNDLVQERFKAGYELRHRLNDVAKLRQNLSYSYIEQEWFDIFYNSHLGADGRTAYSYPYYYWGEMHRLAVDTAVDFTFTTGKIGHTLTTGVDYYGTWEDGRFSQIDYSDPASYYAFDLFRPDYRQRLAPRYVSHSNQQIYGDAVGFYMQEHAKIGAISLTGGLRYDKSWHEDVFDGVTTEDNADAWTPKAGITYEFVPGVAAYANYSRSFAPQWSYRDSSGNALAPEEGENWEAGVKYSLLEGRVTGLISIFELTRQNVATSNLFSADPFDATVSGEQRSRGFEFETGAELAPGLRLTAAYTYIDAEVTADNDIPVGTPLLGVPEHGLSTWLKYTVQSGPLKNFGVGVGASYYSDKSGDTYHTFDIPGYTLWDAALYYEHKDFLFQVNFNNLTDKRHFVGSYSDMYVLPGQPFNVSASVTWKF